MLLFVSDRNINIKWYSKRQKYRILLKTVCGVIRFRLWIQKLKHGVNGYLMMSNAVSWICGGNYNDVKFQKKSKKIELNLECSFDRAIKSYVLSNYFLATRLIVRRRFGIQVKVGRENFLKSRSDVQLLSNVLCFTELLIYSFQSKKTIF